MLRHLVAPECLAEGVHLRVIERKVVETLALRQPPSGRSGALVAAAALRAHLVGREAIGKATLRLVTGR